MSGKTTAPSRFVPIAVLGLVAWGLCACGATTSTVSDDLWLSALQNANSGIAVMMMGIAGKTCPAADVTLGRKVEGGFKADRVVRIRNNLIGKGAAPQIELAPGTYHVVHWVCTQGRLVQSVGRTNNALFGIGEKYLKSYASFTINAGEVVNLGYLRMTDAGGYGFVRFDVTDLTPQAHSYLKKERPRLYAQMTTRLMTAENKPLSDKQRKAYCKLVLALNKITENSDQLPKECAAPTGTF